MTGGPPSVAPSRARSWPTSSESEASILAELRQNPRGRTGIVISHRFSAVRVADQIAVLAAGRAGELETHELMAARGRHARLFELPAAGYR